MEVFSLELSSFSRGETSAWVEEKIGICWLLAFWEQDREEPEDSIVQYIAS